MNHMIVNSTFKHTDGTIALRMGFTENVRFEDDSVHRLHEPINHVGVTECGVFFTNKGCETCSLPIQPDGPVAEITADEVTCDSCKKYLK